MENTETYNGHPKWTPMVFNMKYVDILPLKESDGNYTFFFSSPSWSQI